MGIASIVHLYVFPAKPYSLMGERLTGTVSVLGDYASVDCPLDPDEVRDSERPTKLRLPQPGPDIKSRTAIRESVRDVVFGGGVYVRIPTTIFFFLNGHYHLFLIQTSFKATSQEFQTQVCI